MLAENHIYYIIYDKSNILYNKSENSLKHDKTGLLAFQLSRRREENRIEEKKREEKRREEKRREEKKLFVIMKLDHIFCFIPISTLLFSEGWYLPAVGQPIIFY
jgi:hypothetical protein